MHIVITGATVDPETLVSVADIKAHLRVTHAHEDALIALIRNASIAYVEDYCETKLGSYTAEAYMSRFRTSWFTMSPVTAIASVKYQATADDSVFTLLDSSLWYKDIRSSPSRIAFRDTPTLYDYALAPVQINCTVGWAVVPSPLVSAIKLLAADLYENRQEEIAGTMTTRLKLGIEALMAPFRTLV